MATEPTPILPTILTKLSESLRIPTRVQRYRAKRQKVKHLPILRSSCKDLVLVPGAARVWHENLPGEGYPVRPAALGAREYLDHAKVHAPGRPRTCRRAGPGRVES